MALANFPLDKLVREHTELVCGMNRALFDGLARRIGDGVFTARLNPGDDRCCVVLDIA